MELSGSIDMFVRLAVATLLGAAIGIEREKQGKEAGFRTHALVCLGSALIMIVSIQIFEMYGRAAGVDPSRIAAQVVSGIGFLGAGAIIRSPRGVTGLTTAAGVWTAAGIGLACGLGLYRPALITTGIVLFVYIIFSKLGRLLNGEENGENSSNITG